MNFQPKQLSGRGPVLRCLRSLAILLVAGCSPTMQIEDGVAGDGAFADGVVTDRGPRDTGVDFFDAVEPMNRRDGSVTIDVPNPTTCEGWCVNLLIECATPAAVAASVCDARCATLMNPNSAIQCLREARCTDLSNAVARGVSFCGLDPVLDSGVRPDVPNPRDVLTDIPNARDVPNPRDVPTDIPNARDVPTDIPNARDVPTDIPNARDVPTDIRG